MPTKLNRAGNQQNYVPAGNGDASGEYGDNSSGSNKHFTAFEKPKDTGNKVEVKKADTSVKEQPKESPKARTDELSKKQIKEIGNYVKDRDLNNQENVNRIIRNLRYYNGSFGDLSQFSDDDLKAIINDLGNLKTSDELVWFKDKGKWFATHNTGLLEKMGVDYYSTEEKYKKQAEDNRKIIESSQNETDKEIQKIIGDNCTVCFGKGYNKDDLKQVLEDTKTYINDFPELKNQLKLMGDRNNLEKLVNAIRTNTEPSEEEILVKIKQLKRMYIYDENDKDFEKELREKAIIQLQKPITLSKLNRALAYWSPSENAMIYMGKMKNWDSEDTEHSYNVNWHSSNKVNGVYCHEMGHAVDTALDKKYNDIEKNLDYDKRIALGSAYRNFRNNIQELYNQNYNKEYKDRYDALVREKYNKPDVDNRYTYNREKYEAENYAKEQLRKSGIKKYNISEYGNTNIKEFVAECFSAHYSNMNNPLADKVVNAFQEMSKELRRYE